jgi:DNA-binding transcriptional regulator PaaX
MQGAEVADRIEAQAAEIERLREALRDLIEQCWSCEKELTEEYYGTHYSGESLPLCNARAALGETE